MESKLKLKSSEMLRYDRQLPLLGVEGQAKLKSLSVLVAGVGGLGSFEAIHLALLGVGRLILVDHDVIDPTNLNRQPLYTESDVGKPKVLVAAEKLSKLNPNVRVEAINARIDESTVNKLLEDVDIVVDGLDNWEARFILDEAAYRKGIPFIHAGVYGLQGQVVVIVPGETSCLRCLLPPRLTSPEKVVAVSPMVGLVASIAIIELLKLVTGVGKPNKGSLIIVDGYNMEVSTIKLEARRGCSC